MLNLCYTLTPKSALVCIMHMLTFRLLHIYIYLYLYWWVESSPMVRKTWVQSQVESYQRLLKWYLIPPCLALSNIRYVSMIKWSNPGKEVAPSPTPRCSSYWKGSLLIALDYGRQLTIFIQHIHILGENRVQWYIIYNNICCDCYRSAIYNKILVSFNAISTFMGY